MEAVAKTKFARYSYRKVGQVLSLIKGKTVRWGYNALPNVPRAASNMVFKTLKSAFSNLGAADPDKTYVKAAWADNGPSMKRVRPMAMGARAIYKRKTCHVTIVVTDEKPKKKR